MTNSRAKGARGERELAHVLQEYGYETRRGQQFSGANGDADVVGLPNIHIECKRVERLNIENAMKQSSRDARDGEVPVVMHDISGNLSWGNWYTCNQCEFKTYAIEHHITQYNYCPNCGAKMDR